MNVRPRRCPGHRLPDVQRPSSSGTPLASQKYGSISRDSVSLLASASFLLPFSEPTSVSTQRGNGRRCAPPAHPCGPRGRSAPAGGWGRSSLDSPTKWCPHAGALQNARQGWLKPDGVDDHVALQRVNDSSLSRFCMSTGSGPGLQAPSGVVGHLSGCASMPSTDTKPSG